jgi:orotidine-5'-phosphate decarboxylase
VGAVVGATCSDANGIVQMMPQSFILAPGIGAQGATISDLLTRMPHARGRVLPSVSRGVLAKGTSIEAIRSAITELNAQAIKALCD